MEATSVIIQAVRVGKAEVLVVAGRSVLGVAPTLCGFPQKRIPVEDSFQLKTREI